MNKKQNDDFSVPFILWLIMLAIGLMLYLYNFDTTNTTIKEPTMAPIENTNK